MRFQWRLHRLAWDLSGGRLGRRVNGMPVLELVTTGHRSGEPRSILINYVATPDPVLAGTNAGSNREPAWIKNLRANPHARVREGKTWSRVNARFLEGEEWESAWQEFLTHRGYADYERMLERPVPLVRLEKAP